MTVALAVSVSTPVVACGDHSGEPDDAGAATSASAGSGAASSGSSSSTGEAGEGSGGTGGEPSGGAGAGGGIGENCSDRADNDGDGLVDCDDSADCAAVCAGCKSATPFNAIPGQPSISAGIGWTGSSAFQGSCVGGAPGQERVFAITSVQSGLFTAATSSSFDLGFYVRTACSDEGAELACVNSGTTGTESAFVPMGAAESLTLFVDAAGPPGLDSWTITLDFWGSDETEPNDAADTAGTFAGTFEATIAPAGDQDYIAVDVPAGASLVADVTGWGGDDCAAGMDPELEIVASDGSTSLAAADDDDDGCAMVSASGLAAGTHYVRVAASEKAPAATRFGYALSVTVQSPP